VIERVPDSVILTGRQTRYSPGPVPSAFGARVWEPAFVTIEEHEDFREGRGGVEGPMADLRAHG